MRGGVDLRRTSKVSSVAELQAAEKGSLSDAQIRAAFAYRFCPHSSSLPLSSCAFSLSDASCFSRCELMVYANMQEARHRGARAAG